MRQEVKSRDSATPRVSVIIPTLNPGPERFRALVRALRCQQGVKTEIIVADSTSTDGSADLLHLADDAFSVAPGSFDHGGTRNAAAACATGEILVFMTQDALPANDFTLATLIAPIVRGEVVGAYARQVAPATTSLLEQVARQLNYPPESAVRSLADVPRLGIRAFMLPNVTSAVERPVFVDLGGFPEPIVFNEDLHLANAILSSGGSIAYVADAVVEHGHTYTLLGLLRRYFDNATSLVNAPEPLRSARATGAGLRFALAQGSAVIRARRFGLLPRWLSETAVKWLGFQLGMVHRFLPIAARRLLGLRPGSRAPDATLAALVKTTAPPVSGTERNPTADERSNKP